MICDGICGTLLGKLKWERSRASFFAEKVPGNLLLLCKRTVTLPAEFLSHTLKHQLFFVTVSETTCKTEMLCELTGKLTLRTFTDIRQSCLGNSRLQV